MSSIDFSDQRRTRKPTRKERGVYQEWVRYLTDSRLSQDEIHTRAAAYTSQGRKPPPRKEW